MNRLRSLLAALFVTALLVTAVSAMPGTTSATMTDRVQTSGSVSVLGLPLPVNVTATFEDGAATVRWDSAAGDFASSYQVFRYAGACDGRAPSGSPLASVTASASPASYAYPDASSLSAGETYCYAVRGTIEGWWSDAVEASVSIPAAPAAPTRLYVSPNSITTAPASASTDVLTNGASRLYASTGTHTVTSSSGWTASVALLARNNPSNALNLTIAVWYTAGAGDACGTSAPAAGSGRLIATGAGTWSNSGSTTTFSPPETLTIALTGSSQFQAPGEERAVCMSASASVGGGGGPAFTIGYGGGYATWLEGPIAP